MRHILVVEDDNVNALLFRHILEKRGGFRVTVTEDAAEVIGAARERSADLVIMDVSLSHTKIDGRSVSGVELCRVLKDDPTTAAVPVVLATAHAMRGDAEHLMRDSGAEDYVSKPIVDHAAFVEQIRGHLADAA